MVGEYEFNRVLSAALVSEHFRELLLTNPQGAIEAGFNGENFHLEPEIMTAIASIKAQSLETFVQEVLTRVNGNGVSTTPAKAFQ